MTPVPISDPAIAPVTVSPSRRMASLIHQNTIILSNEHHYVTLLDHYRSSKRLDTTNDCLATSHLDTLIINLFPSPGLCAKIGELANENNGIEIASHVSTVVITEQAVIQLLLSGPDLLDQLSGSLEEFIHLACPDRLEVSGIDHLYDSRAKYKWSRSPFDVLDQLIELWLSESLESLVMQGQHHRIHRWNFANSSKLTYELVWTHIFDPKLNYSSQQASQTPPMPYLMLSPLKQEDRSGRKITWLADQAYPHVHAFLMRESKRPSKRKMVISCPELTPLELQGVCHELIVQAQMMLGGKADVMIMDSTKKSRKNAPNKVIVNVGSGGLRRQ